MKNLQRQSIIALTCLLLTLAGSSSSLAASHLQSGFAAGAKPVPSVNGNCAKTAVGSVAQLMGSTDRVKCTLVGSRYIWSRLKPSAGTTSSQQTTQTVINLPGWPCTKAQLGNKYVVSERATTARAKDPSSGKYTWTVAP